MAGEANVSSSESGDALYDYGGRIAEALYQNDSNIERPPEVDASFKKNISRSSLAVKALLKFSMKPDADHDSYYKPFLQEAKKLLSVVNLKSVELLKIERCPLDGSLQKLGKLKHK